MRFSGVHATGRLIEILELEDHPWFLAVQFHPEFKSKPTAPHPLFFDFIGAALERRSGKKQREAALEEKG
jgi:CTP synthase